MNVEEQTQIDVSVDEQVDPATLHYNQAGEDQSNENYGWLISEEVATEEKIRRLDEEIKEIQKFIYDEKHPLSFGDEANLYSNVRDYLKKVKAFIYNDVQYSQYDFITLEIIHQDILTALNNYKEGDVVLFDASLYDNFVRLALATQRTGYKSVKNLKYILKPFNQTYAIIGEKVNHQQNLKQALERQYQIKGDEDLLEIEERQASELDETESTEK